MGYCNHCVVFEHILDCFINKLFCFYVDTGGGLIDQYDLTLLEKGSSYAHKLLLPDT